MSPPPWPGSLAMSALRDAREALRDADEAICLLAFVVRTLCRERREPVHDAAAERRVLGAMLLGRATAFDVEKLEPEDFCAPGHRELFAVLHATLTTCATPPGQPRRAALTPLVRRVLRRLPGGSIAAGVALPWPATCPRDEIETIGALASCRRRAIGGT